MVQYILVMMWFIITVFFCHDKQIFEMNKDIKNQYLWIFCWSNYLWKLYPAI